MIFNEHFRKVSKIQRMHAPPEVKGHYDCSSTPEGTINQCLQTTHSFHHRWQQTAYISAPGIVCIKVKCPEPSCGQKVTLMAHCGYSIDPRASHH